MTLRDELQKRPSYLDNLDAKQRATVRKAFADNPTWEALYLFYDGSVKEEKAFQGQCNTREAGIVSMATEGIPIIINRNAFARRCPDTEVETND